MSDLFFEYNEGANPILFLHGFMGSIKDWSYFKENLDNGILAIDLPGHGKSLNLDQEQYNFSSSLDKIINLIENLNIDQLNMVAYSMGARVAFGLLSKRPQLFNKVILESGNPGIKSKEQRIKRKESDSVLADKIKENGLDKFLDSWYNLELWGNIKEHKEYENMRRSRLQNSTLELAKSLEFMGTGNQKSYWENLQGLKNDIIFVTGENDKKYSQVGKDIIELNPKIQLKIIKDAAHNVHFEKKEEFLKLITDFI